MRSRRIADVAGPIVVIVGGGNSDRVRAQAVPIEVEVAIELNVARSAEEAARQAKGETLTSADAIYGVDEDALRPEDFFDPDADGEGEDE